MFVNMPQTQVQIHYKMMHVFRLYEAQDYHFYFLITVGIQKCASPAICAKDYKWFLRHKSLN